MEQIVIIRQVNAFYYLLFLLYTIIFLILIIPRCKKQPFKNSLKIFVATSIVLIAMEFFGTFTQIRVFYIDGQVNIGVQLLLQVIMGVGEGGTAAAIIYLMVESVYQKNMKKYGFLLLSLAILMATFASFTFIHKHL